VFIGKDRQFNRRYPYSADPWGRFRQRAGVRNGRADEARDPPCLDNDEIAGWRRRGHRDANARRGTRFCLGRWALPHHRDMAPCIPLWNEWRRHLGLAGRLQPCVTSSRVRCGPLAPGAAASSSAAFGFGDMTGSGVSSPAETASSSGSFVPASGTSSGYALLAISVASTTNFMGTRQADTIFM